MFAKRTLFAMLVPVLLTGLLFWSCDYGQLEDADQTHKYQPEDALFIEGMDFLSGVWYSYYDGERLDGYRIRKWRDFSAEDRTRAQALFPNINLNADNPKTYSTQDFPQNGDYVILFDDNATGDSWGFGFMGLVRTINIFNGDKNRGAIIAEYFEGTDPQWLSWEGLTSSEKPFFGIYYQVLDSDTVQMASAVDLAAMYAGESYYTEKKTLNEAIKTFNVENEAEFVNWGVTSPQEREK